MNKRYARLLFGIFSIAALAFLLSVVAILQGRIGNFEPITYGAGFIVFSAFIWGDLLVFSLLWMVLVPILFKLKNPYYLLLAWSGFWLIRAIGEVMYSFMQQFQPGTRPYVAYLPRSILLSPYGPAAYPKYWVLEQIFFQSVAVLALLGAVYALVQLIRSAIKFK